VFQITPNTDQDLYFHEDLYNTGFIIRENLCQDSTVTAENTVDYCNQPQMNQYQPCLIDHLNDTSATFVRPSPQCNYHLAPSSFNTPSFRSKQPGSGFYYEQPSGKIEHIVRHGCNRNIGLEIEPNEQEPGTRLSTDNYKIIQTYPIPITEV